MPDYSTVAVSVVKELIGIAASFIPPPKFQDKPLLTESEAAAINSDRIKLVRVLLEEVKSDVKCPSCIAHVDKSLDDVAWLEKEVPRIERVTALRENLKNLLEEAQKEMRISEAVGFEPSIEPLEPLLEEKHTEKSKETSVSALSSAISAKKVIEPPGATKPTEVAKVKSACVPCAIGHYATSAKLLAEATRFKADGLESPQVQDDIAEAIAEQNALERIDLTPAKIEKLPPWEKDLASDALVKSRELRHKLESVKDMEQVEVIAAETENYFKGLNRSWLSTKAAKIKEKKVLNSQTTTNI